MIKIIHLQKVEEQTVIVDLPELTVSAGEITAVTGLTGSHKTTFLALLTGQTSPTAGTIRLADIDPLQERQDFAQTVGILPSENGLYPKLSARQNLTFYCDLYGLPHGRADEILQYVGLQDQTKTHSDDLAPGLARRLAFGRSILHQPQVLILVDPLLECDQASITLLLRLLQNEVERQTAVLIIANDLTQLRPYCQTVIEMENGRFINQYNQEEQQPQANLPFKIPARLEGKVVLVNPSDILYATAEDGRTALSTPDGNIATHLTLSEVEDRLARSGFFRAHRSYLVNIQHIKEIISYTRNSYTLILDGGSVENGRIEIPLSKGAARELRELLDY